MVEKINKNKILMDQEAIKKVIPHREPFLLVDSITKLEPGKSATGIWQVKEDEYFFKGHFPEKPIVPGALLIESMAQVGAVAALSVPDFAGKIAFFAGIDKARFKKMVEPGDQLKSEVKLIKMRGPIGIGEGTAFVDDKIAVKAKLTFAIK